MFLLEGDICKAQIWLEEAPPGQGSRCLTCDCLLSHQQTCVKERASKSMQCVRDLSDKEARAVVETVFQTCFTDTDPFERVPP